MTADFWRGKRVLVTGHTGFKGGWMSLWLQSMGAELHGYALSPPTEPNLYAAAAIAPHMSSSSICDIRDFDKLLAVVQRVRPEIVFHFAAQALVRRAYAKPLDTYGTNVMGTVHLFEAIRAVGNVKAVVNVTSDKCYEDFESTEAHVEGEPLGGRDPYASSKACAELVTTAYRESFLAGQGVALASARAGNVIGGGDWADDRLLPDIVRSLESGSPLLLRHPGAVRPWQHILEPLQAYLLLAECLYTRGAEFAEAWNFGPQDESSWTVRRIVEYVASKNPALVWSHDTSAQPLEAARLKLDSRKAHSRLGWGPRWHLQTALDMTLNWYQAMREGQDMRDATLAQIGQYLAHGEDNSSLVTEAGRAGF